MSPRETAERLMGLRKVKGVPFVVKDARECPFRKRHGGISPADDHCMVAFLPTLEGAGEWTVRWYRGKGKNEREVGQVLQCPDRRGKMVEWKAPPECPIRTENLKIILKEKKE